jgi:hypothetical protein
MFGLVSVFLFLVTVGLNPSRQHFSIMVICNLGQLPLFYHVSWPQYIRLDGRINFYEAASQIYINRDGQLIHPKGYLLLKFQKLQFAVNSTAILLRYVKVLTARRKSRNALNDATLAVHVHPTVIALGEFSIADSIYSDAHLSWIHTSIASSSSTTSGQAPRDYIDCVRYMTYFPHRLRYTR